MADVRKLINSLADAVAKITESEFLAPCVRGGSVRTKVSGLLYTFKPMPEDFEGWGIFKPLNEQSAKLVEEASFFQIAEYLKLFPSLRVRFAYQLKGQTWLAYPANESDMKQRFAPSATEIKPFAVHLVTEGQQFETAIVRQIGGVWLFEEIDRRAAPEDAGNLREAWRNKLPTEDLKWKGLTPEMRVCYSIVFSREKLEQERKLQHQQSRGEKRLRDALEFSGGALREFSDRGDYWLVEWTARNGELHSSAISKDLTVVSAGICLSGEDEKFDLQSLVGVVEDWH